MTKINDFCKKTVKENLGPVDTGNNRCFEFFFTLAFRKEVKQHMKRIREAMSCEKGFTLVELLVVIGIIGILAMMLLPQFSGMRDRARIASCQSNLKNIGTQLESFYADRERYPDNTEWGTDFAILGIASCPHDGSAYQYVAGATLSGPASGANDIYEATDIVVPTPALVAGPGVRIDTYVVQCTFHDGSGVDGAGNAAEAAKTQLIISNEGLERRPL